jgi:hypothetical protein
MVDIDTRDPLFILFEHPYSQSPNHLSCASVEGLMEKGFAKDEGLARDGFIGRRGERREEPLPTQGALSGQPCQRSP